MYVILFVISLFFMVLKGDLYCVASCTKNIGDYMHEKLGIEKSKIPELSNFLYKTYGTTMAGLRAIGYDFDYDEYHSFVHGRLPYENLKPDPVLRSLLLSLPYRKVVFTNADKIHAPKCLNRLGLEGCFEGILCFETLNPTHNNNINSDGEDEQNTELFDIFEHFSQPGNSQSELPKTPNVCKPSESAIEQALSVVGINPHKIIFFDDSTRNIDSGKCVGLTTVLVSYSINTIMHKSLSLNSHRCKGADYALESLHNIREALPELWDVAENKSEQMVTKIGIETSVIS
ncbi:hypothetical protein MKX03_013524 [Papaver bracteatum]|nr:hypothetical protein MKX03_013524 [Papaver bracteatum]